MSANLRYKKRPTRRLQEVIEVDLLTAQEQYIKKQIGGFYSLNDEAAYFRIPGEKSAMTIDELERKIKKEIHPQFFIMYNPTITAKHMVEGHGIGFYVPEFRGFVPLCRVGRSGNRIIPANSQGSKESYIGKTSLKLKEKAVISRGWVAAYEFCKQFLFDAKETGGIKRSRIVQAGEFMVLRDMANNLGGEEAVSQMFAEAKKIAENEMDRLVIEAKKKEEDLKVIEEAAAKEFDEKVQEAVAQEV